MRVLIADDNRDAADTLALVLRFWGHEVRVAYEGSAALVAARFFKPHATLLDIQMPHLNGGEVALKLRWQDGFEEMLIVAMTATAQDDPRFERYNDAFDAFLSKPCDLDHLAEVLTHRHSYTNHHHE